MSEYTDRYARQLGIYNPEGKRDHVTMIGCGGIGSFTAFGVAKLGVPKITLIDPDIVEEHNLPNQNFLPEDIGKPKALALAEQIDHNLIDVDTWTGTAENYDPGVDGLVLSGVDSMSARKDIWEQCIKLNPRVSLYIDGRLSGEYMLAYAVNPTSGEDIERYERTLHSDDEGEAVACTERGIIDVGLQIASMLTMHTRNHLNGKEIPSITMMNMASYTASSGQWVR